MSHRHTSKAWSPSYDRLDTRSNDDAMTQRQRRRITYVAVTNTYNSELAELSLRFKGKDQILVNGVVEAVLLAFTVQISSSMNIRPRSSSLGRTCRRRGLRRPDWIIACVVARLGTIWKQVIIVYRGRILADGCILLLKAAPPSVCLSPVWKKFRHR